MKKRVIWLRLNDGGDLMFVPGDITGEQVADILATSEWFVGESSAQEGAFLGVKVDLVAWFSIEEIEVPDEEQPAPEAAPEPEDFGPPEIRDDQDSNGNGSGLVHRPAVGLGGPRGV